jgi:hypothetical protein
MSDYWSVFLTLLATPFEHIKLVWGIVPLYFGLLLSEMTSNKANFRTALQTGFSFLWAAAQWIYPYFLSHEAKVRPTEWSFQLPVKFFVTLLVVAMGMVALVSGLRKRFPRYGRFLGYTRFANYFMIAIFPMQANALDWTWRRLLAIVLFALPIWVLLHFGFMPVRKAKSA